MRSVIIAAFALAACASAPREPFSVDALVADAPAYITARYQGDELPAALIADLEAASFQCQQSETVSECGHSQRAHGSCFHITTVRIEAERARAERNTRCMGVTQ
jgi:hypothetical protein